MLVCIITEMHAGAKFFEYVCMYACTATCPKGGGDRSIHTYKHRHLHVGSLGASLLGKY